MNERAGGEPLRALEHQVLEEVREAGGARTLVAGKALPDSSVIQPR